MQIFFCIYPSCRSCIHLPDYGISKDTFFSFLFFRLYTHTILFYFFKFLLLILSYLETEFVLTTHVKALDLKGFAALTSTSEAREVKDFLSMRGRSREAALLKVISCVPVPLGTCSCLQPFPVCLLSIWRKPAALRDTGLIGQPTSILSNSSTFDPASHMLLLRPAVFSLL